MRGLAALVFTAALLAGHGPALAQSSSDWVELCEEDAGGVTCQGWSVTGGDMLELIYGCTGATGGGLLVCGGRTLCEVAGLVTVRGFEDRCEAAEAAPEGGGESGGVDTAEGSGEEAGAAAGSSFDPEAFGEPDGSGTDGSGTDGSEAGGSQAVGAVAPGGAGGGGGRSGGGETCWVKDPEDEAVNVRATPNGTIVNRLRNGRVVTMTGASLDEEGRPWLIVESAHEGRWRRWGYVFGEIARCD